MGNQSVVQSPNKARRGGKRCSKTPHVFTYAALPSLVTGSGASILQKAEIRLINQSVCNELLTDQLTPRMMCVGILTGGVDACQVGQRCGSTRVCCCEEEP